jgi:hypothetical protein
MSDLLVAALATVKLGVPVFQLAPRSKVPTRGSNGFKDATRDPGIVNALWNETPDANIGVPMGRASGRVVLDIDPRHDGDETLPRLLGDYQLPDTQRILTMGHDGGWQYVFVLPDGTHVPTKVLGAGVELRGEGAYTLWPPSVHPDTGQARRFADDTPPASFPAFLLNLTDAASRRNGGAPPIGDVIPAGQRNQALASLAGTMRRRGMNEAAILAALTATNQLQCQPALSSDEVEAIAGSVSRYEPAKPVGVAAYTGTQRTLDDVVATFRRHLYMPDSSPLVITLAAIVANQMRDGDPVWVVIIGGSSRGKTEILLALDGIPGVRITGTVTVASLLSGTSKRDQAKTATGGILRELGDEGILVVKDLGAILTLHRETRAEVLQALRDIYDGRYTRDVGVDGGRKLEWMGRLGLVAGATSELDRAQSVMSALGERWVTVRLPEGGEDRMVDQALDGVDTDAMRRDLRDVIHGFISKVGVVAMRKPTSEEKDALRALAPLVVLARSPVARDPAKRDIVFVHQAEGPARLARQLLKLLVALEAAGADPLRVVVRAGIDSIPSPRREVLLFLLEHGEESTTRIAVELDLPRTTTRNALEELTVHGVAQRRKTTDEDNSPDVWSATEMTHARWSVIAAYWRETA